MRKILISIFIVSFLLFGGGYSFISIPVTLIAATAATNVDKLVFIVESGLFIYDIYNTGKSFASGAEQKMKQIDFDSTTQKGNFGEELAALTHKGKTRLPSHYGGGHGPDNVYIDSNNNVTIEEVKVDTSTYKSEQVSNEQLEKWIKKMKLSKSPHVQETGKILENAMKNGKLTRVYTRVDTVAGTITKQIVDEYGKIIRELPPVQITKTMISTAVKRIPGLAGLGKTLVKVGKFVVKVVL